MTERVTATPRALELLERLRAQHGDLIVHLSGGCCDGSSPMCLRASDLPAGAHDVRLGEMAGAHVVIDAEQDRRWQHPTFHIDVAAGEAGGFSLEALEHVHLTLESGSGRSRPPPADPGSHAAGPPASGVNAARNLTPLAPGGNRPSRS